MISRTLNIGRNRGEFERATKAMRSMQGGHRDPAKQLHEISEAASRYEQVAEFANAQRKEGRLLSGVPNDLWAERMAEAPLQRLDPELLHVFLPEYRETRIRGGVISFVYEGSTQVWCEPELFADLGDGFRLMVKFDPTEPCLGAALFCAETGPQNRHGWPVGQYLGNAENLPEAPQLTLCDDFELAGGDAKKRWAKAVRSEYRAIGTGAAASEARDGRGAVASVRQLASAHVESEQEAGSEQEAAANKDVNNETERMRNRSRRVKTRSDGRSGTMTERDRDRLRRRQAHLVDAGLL